jgi:hypothetical protein
MAEIAGLSYAEMLRDILNACDERVRAAVRRSAALRAA